MSALVPLAGTAPRGFDVLLRGRVAGARTAEPRSRPIEQKQNCPDAK